MRLHLWVVLVLAGLSLATIIAWVDNTRGSGLAVTHAQQAALTLSIRHAQTGSPDATCTSGGLVVMRISVEAVQGLSALSFSLKFDQSVARISSDGVSSPNDIPSGWLMVSNPNAPGMLVIGMIGTTVPSTNSFAIADVTFECGGSQTIATELTFTDVVAATVDEVVLQTEIAGGSITIVSLEPTNPPEVDLADLSIVNTSDPNPVDAGSAFVYTVTVINNGPDGATNVTMTDTLPPGIVFKSAVATQGACSQSAGIVVCEFGGLFFGGTATAIIHVTPDLGAAGVFTNTASVTGDQSDAVGDNTAIETTTVLFVGAVNDGAGEGSGGGGGGGAPSPTAVPAVVPTAVLTAVPTAVPPAAPTAVPTVTPTAVPPAEPTAAPTATPTAAPTATPTAMPTAPTAMPTAAPTNVPMAAPTAVPTTVPAAVPTTAPADTLVPPTQTLGGGGGDDESGLSAAAIAGIIAAVVMVVAAIVFYGVIWRRGRFA